VYTKGLSQQQEVETQNASLRCFLVVVANRDELMQAAR
jgi:hypothetical protein